MDLEAQKLCDGLGCGNNKSLDRKRGGGYPLSMSETARKRLVVLGLDGLPLPLAKELCERGVTPNLARIALAPQATTVRAELPELSPTNWTSFYTGQGPEHHGVFGFTRIDPSSYQIGIADSSAVAVPSIFDALGERGLTSKVINLPNTYPAKPLKGMLISGFVAPELSRAVFPPFLAGPLGQAGYKLEADTTRAKDDPEHLLSELSAALETRRTALNMLWPDLAWDLFIFVLTETDRLFHFLYTSLNSPAVEAFLRQWDVLVGEVLDRYEALPSPKRLVVLADHGFTALETEVDVNSWLVREGLLRLADSAAHENDAAAITSDSKAFALDPGRVYLHTRERFARGGVMPVEVASLLERIGNAARSISFKGRKVIRAVHHRDALYDGPRFPAAPDLVLEPEPGFSLTAKFDGRQVFGFHGRTGVHTADNAIFYDSEGDTPQRMRDVGQLVLNYLR